MKIVPLLLVASVAANAALIALLVAGLSSAPSDSAALAVKATPAAARGATAASSDDPSWVALQGLELAQQRDRLRAEGFPPSVIRAILFAQIREGFAARRKAIDAARRDAPFWKNPIPDRETQAALRALDKEEQQALKDLLGRDNENGFAASLRRQFPDYSADQIDALAAIRERYDEQRRELTDAARGTGGMITYTPEERARITALDKSMHDEFAAVLTPAQLEDYDLRTSNTANNLRYNLGAFELNESEFRAVYRLQAAFNDDIATINGPSASQEQMRARLEAQKKLNSDIAAALGADRYAEYQRATDYNYRQTSQLTTRLGLPPETANQLYAIQKEFETRRNAPPEPGNTGPLTSAEMSQRRAALQAEALAKVTPLLGTPAALEAYKQYGGQWLQNLAPRPVPAAAGANSLIGASPAPAPKP